jgi:hypothetical protein
MIVTPTATSSFASGMGLWGIFWSVVFKIEKIAKLCKCDRYIKRETIFNWINDNKVIALVLTEILNLGKEGISSSTAVTFALGGTFVNTIMIFIVIPARQGIRSVFSK